MPAYGASSIGFNSGHNTNVWTNELVAVGGKSVSVSVPRRDYATVLAVEIQFAADPGTFQVDLQTADTDSEAFFVSRVSVDSTGVNASFVCRIEALDIVARFARLVMVSKANAVNVTARIT